MIDIQDVGTVPAEQLPQSRFPLEERQATQIFSVQPEQVEGGVEERFAAAENQLVKDRAALFIEASDLAIDHSVLEGFVFVAPAGDKTAGSIFDIGEGALTVEFDLHRSSLRSRKVSVTRKTHR